MIHLRGVVTLNLFLLITEKITWIVNLESEKEYNEMEEFE